jgi:ketosteroid isomerase-like protein
MANERDDVYRANEAFYSAFESLDLKEMETVWVHENYIQCFHPGWGLLRGWGPVMASWRRIFENTEEIRFILTDVRIEVRGSLAWVTLCENITSRIGEEVTTGVVLTTNIYEKRPEGWFIIHHHGSTVAQPPAQSSSTTFH